MELNKLFAEEREIEVSGVKIKVKSLELKNISKVADAISNHFVNVDKKNSSEVILGLVKDPNALTLVLESTTNLKKDEIGRLNMAAATEILGEVIKENVDFFTSAVLPKIKKIMEGLQTGS